MPHLARKNVDFVEVVWDLELLLETREGRTEECDWDVVDGDPVAFVPCLADATDQIIVLHDG